jgi:hypothetical protein
VVSVNSVVGLLFAAQQDLRNYCYRQHNEEEHEGETDLMGGAK